MGETEEQLGGEGCCVRCRANYRRGAVVERSKSDAGEVCERGGLNVQNRGNVLEPAVFSILTN